MKWTIAAAVAVVLIAPVPPVAGLLAYGLMIVHAIPWVLRST